MSDTLKFHTVDVFTTKRFAGNPLAIVDDADALTTPQMQAIAREFNLSETIFVLSPQYAAHSAKVRIFFPTAETPFAGHPTIGCAIHLALKANPGDGDFETLITLEEGAGLVPVRAWRKGGVVGAQFTAPVIPHAGGGKDPVAAMVASALGLDVSAIGFSRHKPAQWQGGAHCLFVPVGDVADLKAARPCEPAWSQMVSHVGADLVYVYTRDPAAVPGIYNSRMFAPTVGIPEDPATGAASAILAAQLLASGELQEGLNSFSLRQGYEMGRPSYIGLEIDVLAGRISAVRIAGSSVKVSQGQIAVA
ncbi:MAG: PhzF family phenazine biosynthesis protein [Rhizobiaceae bacterium]